jgi:hypothetical protein
MSNALSILTLDSEHEQESLEDSWKVLRGKPLRRKVVHEPVQPPPPVEPVIKWTLRFHNDESRPSMLVVPGVTAHDRLNFYQKYLSEEWESFRPETVEDIVGNQARDWMEHGVLSNFTDRVGTMKLPKTVRQELLGDHFPTVDWEILWALGHTESLTANGSIREMVDQSHYLFHEVYMVLWSLRFRIKEHHTLEPAIPFFNAIVRWMTGTPLSMTEANELETAGVTRHINTDSERLDVLLFLITLAEQNGLLNRYVVCFDGLERVLTSDNRSLLREMQTFLTMVDRWVHLAQTPIGVLLGMDTSPRHMSTIRRLNKKLAETIDAGVAWAPKPR